MRLISFYLLIIVFFTASAHAEEAVILCDVSKGLELVNQEKLLVNQINMILTSCDKIAPNTPSVLLLHGLYERRQAQATQNYTQAIYWLEKAKALAAPNDFSAALELAATYEWSKNIAKAKAIYQAILGKDPNNRPSLLGLAKIERIQGNLDQAQIIYQQLLLKDAHDVAALNGLGWVLAAKKHLSFATAYFKTALSIQPDNREAMLALIKIKANQSQKLGPSAFCHAGKGLKLINKKNPPFVKIKNILNFCDIYDPDSPEVLLLHGLLERHKAQHSKNYKLAVTWLKKAKEKASQTDIGPSLELAVTYEWAGKNREASALYQTILRQQPNNKAALLGKARLLRAAAEYEQAASIYKLLLKKNSEDIDALNGLGWIALAHKDWNKAYDYFQAVRVKIPDNTEANFAIAKLKMAQLPSRVIFPQCHAMLGLKLLNQPKPPHAEILKILKECDKNAPTMTQTFLLHGLWERFLGKRYKNFTLAFEWLKKAVNSASADNVIPRLELAVTYEWAAKPAKAQLIYQSILTKDPMNRMALLGAARVLRYLKRYSEATRIYEQLLRTNPKELEALNGLGWIKIAQKKYPEAITLFKKILRQEPHNYDAINALKEIKLTLLKPKPALSCDAGLGLMLLNQVDPPIARIEHILIQCDKKEPKAATTLLLHGLLARYFGRQTNQYESAIFWLAKAAATAGLSDFGPAIELAVTYEWAGNYDKALLIYNELLAAKKQNQEALLGKARVLRMQYFITASFAQYQALLLENPKDVEAINGLGQTLMANFEFGKAKEAFVQALKFRPNNPEALAGLQTLRMASKYILSVTGGHYSVPPQVSRGLNIYFYDQLNATNGLTVLATHNSRQIGSDFFAAPTLLPNNSLLLGFQHAIPSLYGWSINYDYRQHNRLPTEHRFLGSASFFLRKNFESYSGFRVGFPGRIWANQLVYSGLTLYTALPVNFSLTGYWAHQAIGGKSSSYSLDLSKEYMSRLFYDMGCSYSPTLKNWEVHGRLILPTFVNQAFVADYSHYFFNNSTFVNAGWRIYWA